MKTISSRVSKINLGFIGAGFIAQECHLPSFNSISDCNLHSIADLHYDLAQKIGKKYRIDNIYENHHELLKNEKVDAVVITLPRYLTSGMVKESLLAGKHVLTEKPLSFNFSMAKELKEIAENNNLLLHVGYMKKYDSGSVMLKQMINDLDANGKKPVLINSCCFMGDSYCNPIDSQKSNSLKKLSISNKEEMPIWLDDKMSNGYENYLNVFTHLIDLFEFLFDEPLNLVKSKINSNGHGITLFEINDTPIELSTMKCDTGDWIEKIDLVYDEQIISINYPPALLKNVPAQITLKYGSQNLIEKKIKPEWSWSFINQAKHFIDSCKSKSLCYKNITSAVNSIKIVEQVFKSTSK